MSESQKAVPCNQNTKQPQSLSDGHSLSLYYWVPDKKSGYSNFGDEISPLVVAEMLKRCGLTDTTVVPSTKDMPKLLAIGSVLHKAGNGDVVWGAGVNGKAWPTKLGEGLFLDVRAVRGPLTRQVLLDYGIECPEVYGDPGLLFPTLYSSTIESVKKPDEKSAKIVYVPNLNDERFGPRSGKTLPQSIMHVSPNNDPIRVARIISEAELVISSSLHGLVFADAYNVPCVPLMSWFEPVYKYIDYFEGTGRANVKLARTMIEALESPPVPPQRIDMKPLFDSFPWDVVR